jgi:RecA-family ATPase
VTALYGDGGSGKTMLALSLMVAMATKYGHDWLGQKVLGWRSVGLFAEDDDGEIVRRIKRMCLDGEIDFAAVAPLIKPIPAVGLDATVAYYAETGELVETALLRDLIALAKADGAVLLVLDYAAAIFGGNEIDRAQVSDFMRRLNAVARENDLAILLLGHPSMDGMRGGRGTSGSTAWRNQARSFLHLTVDDAQDDPDERSLLTLRHTKCNYARSGQTFRLAFNGSAHHLLAVEDTDSKAKKGPRLSPAQKITLKALEKAVVDGGKPSPGGVVPTGVTCASVDLWREYAYSMGVSPSDTVEARRRAFHRARQDLQAKALVGVAEPLAWLIKRAGQ